MPSSYFQIRTDLAVRAGDSGLFISRGLGRHPDRVIDSWELILVRSGCLALDEDGRAYTLRRGEALILEPGLRHRGIADYPPDLSFFWLHFYLSPPGPDASGPAMQTPKQVCCGNPSALFELCQSFLSQQEQRRADPFRLSLILLQILCELTDASTQLPDQALSPFARLADQYIRTCFHQKISARDVAWHVGCNEDYLGRIYRQAYSMTLSQSITHYRIQLACSLLLDSSCSIQEIASQAGYDDPGYFRRVFYKTKGLAPTQYRRRFGKIYINAV
ncbi:MAG TPA: AraC family transcriptional regulator [Clostridiales bacterium]|nr:AraC family transcriptional regulator [Clostridiales bacterium]